VKRIAGLVKSFVSGRSSIGAVLQTSASNVLIQAAYVGSGVITARTLGPSGRGALAAIIMWPQFLSYALTLGIPISSVYHIRRDPKHGSSLTAAAILISVTMGFVASLVGFAVIPHSLHTYAPSTIRFARWAVLISPLALLGVTLSTQVQSAGAFRRYNFFRIAQPLTILVVLFVAWKTGWLTAYSAALAYLLAGLPIISWNFVWVWRHFHPRFEGGAEPIRALLSYGVRAWGADLLGTVANQVDRLLVVSMLPPSSMGLYVVSQSVAGLLNVLPSGMNSVLMPKAAGRPIGEIVELTGRAARVTIAGLTLAALPLFLFGSFLLTLVYGHKYDGAAAILKILLGEAILDGATAVLSQAFLAAGIPGTVTILEGCGLLSAIPLMYWMVPRWGLKGAAFALLFSTFARLSVVMAAFIFKLKMRPPSLIMRAGDISALRRPR
jgi:O-antigen/teichoic acid export membrane protein